MTVKTKTPLDKLRARGVASSSERETWLNARLNMVTATEVAKGSSSYAALISIVEEKKAGGSDFQGNAYTAHGNDREPVIAEWICNKFPGFEANDILFTAEGNDRFGATPDGIGADLNDQVILFEIKTSLYNLNPYDSESHFNSTHYYAQMQWQMFVTGAMKTLFVWEQHKNFEPLGVPKFAWVDRDEETIKKLIETANKILELLDSEEALEDSQFDIEIANLAEEVIEGRLTESEGKAKKEAAFKRIKERLVERGTDYAHSTEKLKISFSAPVIEKVEEFDEEAAKEANPDVFKAFEEAEKAWQECLKKHVRVVEKLKVGSPTITPKKGKSNE